MSDYKPSAAFTVPIKLLIPETKNIKGTIKKTYPEDGDLIWWAFKTYGGTERDVNGVYAIEDTANIETWYRPDIKSDCAIMLAETGEIYEIINDPENINQRNQWCKFKVRRVKGGA